MAEKSLLFWLSWQAVGTCAWEWRVSGQEKEAKVALQKQSGLSLVVGDDVRKENL